ncbi:MAG: D-alanine--D-alanine ligase [Spirochaetales bacterium]|nr:D-alanine--D-alanine ligase [Spirochaetales bacterium]
MKHIVLIYGGRSGEHEVSLRSGAFIYHNIKKCGHIPHPVGISPEGIWYSQDFTEEPEDILPLVEDESRRISLVPGRGIVTGNGSLLPCDVVFPVIHGTFGEDGTLQGLLEMMGLPYVGANVQSSALGMDKVCTKEIWEKAGLPIVPYVRLTKADWADENLNRAAFFKECRHKLDFPLFIKPSRAGSSVGVSRADDESSFFTGIDKALAYDGEILIEKAVDAREIECSLLGNETPEVFGPGEIAPTHDFYDYEAKYIDPDGAALLIPAQIDEKLTHEIRKTALKAYRVLKLNGLSRVDLFLDKKSGRYYLNEVNTMPGFTSISMFPMLCAAEGLEGPELIAKLIQLGEEEFTNKNKLNYHK